MNNPLISVIIPVYKAEKYLDECVQSVVNQTYKNLEIILVDDGSPDRCPQMCDEWAQKDPRIKVIHKTNGGASSARNAGLKIFLGDYVGFVDSDDFIDSNMYETLLRCVQSSKIEIASCYTCVISEKGNTIGKKKCRKREKQYTTVAAINSFFRWSDISSSMCDKIFARKLFLELRFPEGEINEEYSMWIPLMVKSGGVIHWSEQLYFYRENMNSTTHLYWKTDAYMVIKHLKEMLKQIEKYNLEKNMSAFRFFCAKSAYGTAIQLDKHYDQLKEDAKKNLKEYLKIMRDNFWQFQLSDTVAIKDKILYLMMILRVLRPVYKALGKI